MAKPNIQFFFEFSSPYGYLASERIESFARELGVGVDWRPFLIGAAFKRSGAKALLEIPLKAEYARHDIKRQARLLGVPFVLPEAFPIMPISAARAFYWCKEAAPEKAVPLAQAIYRYGFADGGDFGKPETVAEIAESVGLDAAETRSALQDPSVKERLRLEVDAALDEGVFGSPYFIYEGEAFWGVDRLDQLGQWIKSGGW